MKRLHFLIAPASAEDKSLAAAKAQKFPPLPENVECRAVTIWSDGTRMAGDLYLPQGLKAEDRLPGVPPRIAARARASPEIARSSARNSMIGKTNAMRTRLRLRPTPHEPATRAPHTCRPRAGTARHAARR